MLKVLNFRSLETNGISAIKKALRNARYATKKRIPFWRYFLSAKNPTNTSILLSIEVFANFPSESLGSNGMRRQDFGDPSARVLIFC